MALPTIGHTRGISSSSINKATDVAGNVTFALSSSIASTVTISFGYTYGIAPIVIISPINSVSATDSSLIYVTSTQNDFTINISAGANITLSHSYNYHAFETQTNNASGLTIATGAAATTSSRTNATDIAGHFSITPKLNNAGTGATITYGYTYATEPIIVISPTNVLAAIDNICVYTTSYLNKFIVNTTSAILAEVHTYDYHIIETQSNNATFNAITTTTYVAGSQSRTKCTDVAGNVQITPTTAAGTVTFPFGYLYVTAPIVVISATNSAGAVRMNSTYVTSTTSSFTLNLGVGTTDVANFTYHVIETII